MAGHPISDPGAKTDHKDNRTPFIGANLRKVMNRIGTAFRTKYGPWALVTGSSSGIGEEFARQLAGMQLNLVLVARRKEALDELAQELENQYGVSTRTVRADLSDPESIPTIDRATQDIEIGLLVSNAGEGSPGAFLKHDPDQEARLIYLNTTAHMRLSHLFGSKMSQQSRGGIILTSSVGAYQAMPYMASYSAAKAYILNFGEALHVELKRHGVDVTVLVPGPTHTSAMNWEGMKEPSGPPLMWMKSEDVVEAALNSLGRAPSITPGATNKLMSNISRRLMSRIGAASAFGRLMRASIEADRL